MHISLFALSGLFIAISSGIMVFVMFAFAQNRLHRLWGVFCVSVFVWGLGGFLIGTAVNQTVADFWWRIAHVGVAFIPVLFLHFVYNFLEVKKPKSLATFYALAFLFAFLAIFSDALIAHMRLVFDEFYYDSPPGILYPFFTLYFFGLTIYSHYLLYRGYKETKELKEHDMIRKARIRYFFIAMITSFAGGGLSFLPVYGLDVYPLGNFTVTVYPIIVGYAILRLRLFDIRVVTAQGLVLLLWLFVGIRLALSLNNQELILNGLFFIGVLFLGVFLVRSVAHEVEGREKIEHLASDLEKANERLKELDQRKSEFVSLASHQLRSPLTAIKGYSSMLLEGSFGELSDKIKEAVDRIFESSERLVNIVEDFLTISRIEQGRLAYNFASADVRALVEGTVADMRPSIEKKGLSLSFDFEKDKRFFAPIDKGKITQVVVNLIDNAVKYTQHGSITARLSKDDARRVIRFSVVDTGIGMSPETKAKVFSKFVRANNAHEVNVSGTGLGLYIAKQLVEAHKGKIGAESGGEGKGSTFYFELPSAD